jgi:hypothetical protein
VELVDDDEDDKEELEGDMSPPKMADSDDGVEEE